MDQLASWGMNRGQACATLAGGAAPPQGVDGTCLPGAHLPEAHSQHRPGPSGFSCEPHTHATWERHQDLRKSKAFSPQKTPSLAATHCLQGTLETASWTYWARMGGLDT